MNLQEKDEIADSGKIPNFSGGVPRVRENAGS